MGSGRREGGTEGGQNVPGRGGFGQGGWVEKLISKPPVRCYGLMKGADRVVAAAAAAVGLGRTSRAAQPITFQITN